MKLIIQIPCYNEEKTLKETLESIPKSIEGIDEIEILVINDGSTDKTVEIAKNSVNHKVLSAICWAPTILAKAGVVNGKKVTVWLGDDPEYGMKTSKVMENAGATFVNKEVVTDGNLVTGNGPNAAEKFADAVMQKLSD